ncbi:MAG: gliding motility protein GldM [Bacteroidetes bacterium]|nr:gliding motility protein GldM [Bacteroidota bacterium]
MAGSKETTRQKMIGMMYLVLTALLALNVSKEVLEAFNRITRGIDQTMQTTSAKNQALLQEFEDRVGNSGGDSLANICYQKLQAALAKTSQLNAFIEKIKEEAVEAENSQEYSSNEQTSFLGSGMTVLVEQDNVDIASRMLADANHPKYRYGVKLKEMINGAKADIISLFKDLPEMDDKQLETLANAITLEALDDPENSDVDKRAWEYSTFNNVPLGAALAVLTKIQNDIKNTESEVINRLYGQISGKQPPIKGLQAMVTPRSSAVAVGEKFEADIFMGAKVGSILPEIEVDGQKVPLTGSIGKFEAETTQPGTFEKDVTIHFKNAETGKVEKYTTKLSYDVFTTSAIVSADAMNVLYVGLENPISVSVPGYEPEKVNAVLSPAGIGTLRKVGNGKYVAKITNRSASGARVLVTVQNADGSTKQLPPTNFRMKKVPAPYGNILNKTGGEISASALPFVATVNSTLDVNFPFQGVGYTVISYDFIYQVKQGGRVIKNSASSKAIHPDLKAAFQNAKRGDTFIINNIVARLNGSSETSNLPGALVFTVI